MRLEIRGSGVEVTDALREYVTAKMDRVARHSEKLISANVDLKLDKMGQSASANLHLAGNDVYAEAMGQDMYAAIDLLADKLDRAVMKHKEKQVDSNRRAEGLARSIDA